MLAGCVFMSIKKTRGLIFERTTTTTTTTLNTHTHLFGFPLSSGLGYLIVPAAAGYMPDGAGPHAWNSLPMPLYIALPIATRFGICRVDTWEIFLVGEEDSFSPCCCCCCCHKLCGSKASTCNPLRMAHMDFT